MDKRIVYKNDDGTISIIVPAEGADTFAIVAEKQRLRDITNTVDSMTTVEELKGASVK